MEPCLLFAKPSNKIHKLAKSSTVAKLPMADDLNPAPLKIRFITKGNAF